MSTYGIPDDDYGANYIRISQVLLGASMKIDTSVYGWDDNASDLNSGAIQSTS